MNVVRKKSLFISAFMLLLIAISSPVWALDVTIVTKVEGEAKPVVIGKTSLPDGMELMVTIDRKESSYSGQGKAQVSNGEFRVGPFSQNGAPLNTGTYTIEISSPLSTFQPAHVQAIIGKNGEKLKGRIIKKSKYGGSVVEYKTKFRVGGGAASVKMDEAARQQSKKDKHDWWIQSCKENCDMVKVYAAKRGEPFNWNSCYAECLADEPKRK